jgi:hypothetical protein
VHHSVADKSAYCCTDHRDADFSAVGLAYICTDVCTECSTLGIAHHIANCSTNRSTIGLANGRAHSCTDCISHNISHRHPDCCADYSAVGLADICTDFCTDTRLVL